MRGRRLTVKGKPISNYNLSTNLEVCCTFFTQVILKVAMSCVRKLLKHVRIHDACQTFLKVLRYVQESNAVLCWLLEELKTLAER